MKKLPEVFSGDRLFQSSKVLRKVTSISAVINLVKEAQDRGENVAVITSTESSFFPPDAAAAGVDLDALAVIRVAPGTQAEEKIAKNLEKSGAFGLVIKT